MVRARLECWERIQKQSAAMIRVKLPLYCWAKESVRVPHSWEWMDIWVVGCGVRWERLRSRLKAIAPESAGDDGWSVATTVDALARAHTREGRAAPSTLLLARPCAKY